MSAVLDRVSDVAEGLGSTLSRSVSATIVFTSLSVLGLVIIYLLYLSDKQNEREAQLSTLNAEKADAMLMAVIERCVPIVGNSE